MNFVSGLIDPFDVHFAFFVGLVVLVWLALRLQPIRGRQDALGLEYFLRVLSHVGDHGVIGEVLNSANSFEPLLFRHHGVNHGVLFHGSRMLL